MSDPSSGIREWDPDSAGTRQSVPGTQLIGKAFRLIDLIGEAPGLVSTAELSAATGWPKATLYRILAALIAQGFIRFDPVAQGYTLGYRFLELAQNVWTAPDLAAIASTELQRLRDMTGETAYLAVLHEGAVLSLGKFESPHDVRSAARLGMRKPLHCTSQGKAILAFLPEEEVDRLLARAPLERFTPQTITDPDHLRVQLRIVRSRGYAIEDQEILIGNRCVGAPVLDAAGRPVAAISVAGPIYRLTKERVEQLGPEIALAARNIGLALRSMPMKPALPRTASHAHPAEAQPAFYGAHPVWDASHARLLWADRLAPCLYMTGEPRTAPFRLEPFEPIDGVALAPGGEALLVMGARLVKLGEGGHVSEIAAPELVGTQALATDPQGGIWAAVQHGDDTRIARLNEDGSLQTGWTLRGNVGALAWSRDGQRLFAADAQRGTIHRIERNAPSPRLVTRILRVSGEPRSLAVDAEDRLWVGLFDGWSVAKLTEEGDVESLLPLPVPRPTGLAFEARTGGAMYVTTARIGLARDVLENAPLSGRLLIAHPGKAGAIAFSEGVA
ncbi:IclR family transcriptional regulator C-terminal domain-containing protein [Bosea sp. 685]|uniref:IclR family transcriptional regulator domain-containing protein n=1 Tax=Bosea sp. 685 TaxID=3080057 RepID=UPI002892A2DF|nr:IclR family transcriptional regulator C-terminal domain-containing protein [Bosea sp. 685]WNJ88039.1 IclR family transcriptional regulator C-terminal domain-containing protein [Bosea sp. 685]